MKPIRIGLIGCGWFAQAVQLPILTRLPEAQLVALAESDADRLSSARRLVPAATAYDDYEALLERADVDAVIISVPTPRHAGVAIAALRKGLHVYLEKPIATMLEEASAILDAWPQAHVVAMVGFNYRCNELHHSARARIQAGVIGRVLAVRSRFSAKARVLPDWKCCRRTGGGALMELGSHHVDLLRFYFSQEVRSVSAEIRSVRTEDDDASVHLELEGGVHVQSTFSLNAADEDWFEFVGEDGILRVNRYRSLVPQIARRPEERSLARHVRQIAESVAGISYLYHKLRSPWHEPSYRRSLQAFVSAVQGQQVASPDLMDGYRSLEVIEAAEESAKTGRVVDVKSGLLSGSLGIERKQDSGEGP
jgi:predicted dehydrogenase